MILIFLCLLTTALFPQHSLPGTKKAVELCLFSIIPTLFPFFVLNHILLKSGTITSFCNKHMKFFGALFHLPPSSASAVVLGFLSGYPVGSKVAGELYEKNEINRNQYRHITSFCNNAGPAFITGTVGVSMLGSQKYGIHLLFIHIFSAVCVGLIMRLSDNYTPANTIHTIPTHRKTNILQLFSEGVYDSTKSVATVCGFVIFFGYVTSYTLKLPGIYGTALTAIIEMTNGVSSISALPLPMQIKIPLISAILGWGGLCVHAQSFCFLKEKRYYIIGKTLQGIISFVVSYITISLV